MVLLPKPGGTLDEPLQRRPITLLPVIYRLWARIRLRAIEAWRASWDPALVDAPRGPDGQAWALAWDIACAEPSAQAVGGVAVDLTKCYDSVSHPFLRRMLAAAGWPQGISGPLLNAYAAPRRLRVGDVVGTFVRPVAGIPAGCPLAVAVLSVVTWPWQAMAAEAGATTVRRYVDDLTAWHRGIPEHCPLAASAIWTVTEVYAAQAQLTISAAKWGVFASTATTRAELSEREPAAPVLTTFKDLGVQQHAGAFGATAMAARVQATQARFGRLAGLPLPQAKRAQAVAAAGVPAAIYGAVVGAPSNAVLGKLRTWAGRAAWRGAATERWSLGSSSALNTVGRTPWQG